MEADLSAKFDVTDWNESPFDDLDGVPKVSRAVVTKQYTGDVEGTSITEWLMVYAEDGSAEFVGLERIAGSVAGRQGSLVLRHVGSYEDGAAKGTLDVIEGGGSGDLQPVTGAGQFLADPGGSVRLTLTFD